MRKIHKLLRSALFVVLLAGGAVTLGLTLRLVAPGHPAEPAPNATVQPSPAAPLPLTGLTILVDPGHGGYDGGARCMDSGVWEKELNLLTAQAIEKVLVSRGASVVMTRRKDEDLCSDDRPANVTKKRQDMERRVAIAVENSVDMVLSVHMNEYRQRAESGPQVFYRAGCDAGRLLAGCMQQSLIDGLAPRRERAAMAGDYFILQLEMPSVLIECGFISNPEEEALLRTPAYRQRLAEAVADGVVEYVTLARRLNADLLQTPEAAAP